MNAKDLMVERLLKGESIFEYKESGNSMVPLIYSRQPVNIHPVDRELELEDIVFCRIGKQYYLHKITALDGDRVQISNNHGYINGWTHKSNIFGLVET